MPLTQAIDVDDPLAEKVELPTGMDEPTEDFEEFMEAVFEKAHTVSNKASSQGEDIDLSEENLRHVDLVQIDWRDTKVRIWLKDCTMGYCQHVTVRCGERGSFDFIRKKSFILDIREF